MRFQLSIYLGRGFMSPSPGVVHFSSPIDIVVANARYSTSTVWCLTVRFNVLSKCLSVCILFLFYCITTIPRNQCIDRGHALEEPAIASSILDLIQADVSFGSRCVCVCVYEISDTGEINRLVAVVSDLYVCISFTINAIAYN